MDWIWLAVALVILFATIAKGGDWFTYLEEQIRFDSWWADFQLKGFTIILTVAVIAVILYFFLKP